MDLEVIILREVIRQRQIYDIIKYVDYYHMIPYIHMVSRYYHTWNLKPPISSLDTNELTYKTEIHSQTWKTNLWLPKGEGG